MSDIKTLISLLDTDSLNFTKVKSAKCFQVALITEKETHLLNLSKVNEVLREFFAETYYYKSEDGNTHGFVCKFASNAKTSMKSLAHIVKSLNKAANFHYEKTQCWGYDLPDDKMKNFFHSSFNEQILLFTAPVNYEAKFDAKSAQEFCYLYGVFDLETLHSIYFKLACGVDKSPGLKIPTGAVNSQMENAKAVFARDNPQITLQATVDGASLLESHRHKKTLPMQYLFDYLKAHSLCCLAKFIGNHDETPTGLYSWLEFMRLDPNWVALCICNVLAHKQKEGRNLLLHSVDQNIGKTTFAKIIAGVFPKHLRGSLSLNSQRFMFQYATSDKHAIVLADDLQKSHIDSLQEYQGYLDGIVKMPVDRKYARMKRCTLSPLVVTSNIEAHELALFPRVLARFNAIEMKGRGRWDGEFQSLNIYDFIDEPEEDDDEVGACDFATLMFGAISVFAEVIPEGAYDNHEKREPFYKLTSDLISDVKFHNFTLRKQEMATTGVYQFKLRHNSGASVELQIKAEYDA